MTETLALVAGALLVAAAAAWIARPLWTGAEPVGPPDPRAVALLAEREAVLAGLRDVAAEREDGRLSDADYQASMEELTARGVVILAALDSLHETSLGESARRAADLEERVRAAEEALMSVAPQQTAADSGLTQPEEVRVP